MKTFYLTVCFLFIPSLAVANSGIPMLALIWPGMFVSLIPVIVIEAFYYRKKLQIVLKKSLKISSIANLKSTMIGVPMTWFVLYMVELFFAISMFGLRADKWPNKAQDITYSIFNLALGTAWLVSDENVYWQIPYAATVLLIPFFFVTLRLEFKSISRQMPEFEKRVVKEAVLKANLITYGLLAVVCVSWLAITFIKKGI